METQPNPPFSPVFRGAQAATTPDLDPNRGDPIHREPSGPRTPGWQFLAVVGGAILLALLFVRTPSARAAWDEIARYLSLQGKPERASANVLSEHEMEGLDRMSPQSQAELLLERAINHYKGANDQIAGRVDQWRGKITLDQRLNNLFMTAINSDDLRVRAAAIEIDLACRNLEKTSATVDRLEPDARSGGQGPRANALWDLGLLGNRGVEPERAGPILGFDSRFERERSILGGRRVGVSGHGWGGRSAVAGFSRRSFADDSRAGGVRLSAIGHVE